MFLPMCLRSLNKAQIIEKLAICTIFNNSTSIEPTGVVIEAINSISDEEVINAGDTELNETIGASTD